MILLQGNFVMSYIKSKNKYEFFSTPKSFELC